MAEPRIVVRNDAHPVQRVAFGTLEAAEGFREGKSGWSIVTEGDAEWIPITG